MRLWQRLKKNKDPDKPKLIIKREALDFIVATAIESPHVETGGILIGFDIDSSTVIVNFATLPGPNAIQKQGYFLRDNEYCSKILATRYKEYKEDYVGDWHSHIINLRGLSAGDVRSIISVFTDIDYDFNALASIVVSFNGDQTQVTGFIASGTQIYQAKIEII